MSVIRRLRGERGFTMVVVMGAMLIASLATVAAFAAVNGDTTESSKDIGRKQALAAAEAGLNQYLFALNGDNNYWAKCVPSPNPYAVNQVNPGSSRVWASVPGANTSYSIELLPATGYSSCQTGTNVALSMIDAGTRSLRIRVTGRAPSSHGTVTRSIITTLKRDGFLDFLYYTNFETLASPFYTIQVDGRPTTNSATPAQSLEQWAGTHCNTYYRTAGGRASAQWSGTYTDVTPSKSNNFASAGTFGCSQIAFANGDVNAGPLHTNDDLLVCAPATFGRNAQDHIESGASYRSCGGSPTFKGTFEADSATVSPPPSNNSLKSIAQAPYIFSGRTSIQFIGGGKIKVNNAQYTNAVMDYPSTGVIYVQNSGPCSGVKPLDPYGSSTQYCGDAWIQGTYDRDLTIATENDILIQNDVLRASGSDALLGLIANNFVRVEHDTKNMFTAGNGNPPCQNDSTGPSSNGDREVDAAILALQGSWIVDSYWCGASLGTLTVNGVIAQLFRGIVSVGGATGYIKNYQYDPRLQYRSPPHFLDPVQSSWRLTRETEQQPSGT